MLMILSLLVIFTFQSQSIPVEVGIEMAAKAWTFINDMGKDKPKLLLRYTNDNGDKTQKLLRWNSRRIDPSKGPFAYVYSEVDKMLEDKDISRCKLQYYEDGEAFVLNDDDTILDILEMGPDMEGNKRLIGILCDPYPERSGRSDSPESKNKRYIMAKNAYDFAVMTESQPSEKEKNIAEKSLKEANLGAYSLEAEGFSIMDVDGDDFLEKATNIADAFEWDKKTKAIIDAIPSGDKAFKSRSYVKFDAANWKIVGSFAKFAGWNSDKIVDSKNGSTDKKYSMFVATSKFEFTIPRGEREGNLADKYLGAEGGAISQEYMDYIKTVLQFKAIEASRQDIKVPDQSEYMLKDKEDSRYTYKPDL